MQKAQGSRRKGKGQSAKSFKAVIDSPILGSLDFAEEITERYLTTKKADRDLPAVRILSQRPTGESIEKEVEA
jgi:hypothetical protein